MGCDMWLEPMTPRTMNLKIWIWYGVDDDLGRTYDKLWKMTDAYAMETLKGDKLRYYLATLD